MPDHTERFTSRVPYYHVARPRYPDVLLNILTQELHMTPAWTVADIGSGTGISSELFLKHGYTVYGVEPNAAMREASLGYMSAYPNFHAVDGKAEATTLPDHSADLIVCGQAFHWFDPVAARHEFRRILKPEGAVALFWNMRDTSSADPFLLDYEALLQRYNIDYDATKAENATAKAETDESRVDRFFAPLYAQKHTFENDQTLDREGLIGRALSSSYMPLDGDPLFADAVAALGALFERYQKNGIVIIHYTTELYMGALD